MIDNEVPWIQTYTGKHIDPRIISESQVDIEDIAHSLSLQCRFAGHCKRFYSVAEHCVLMTLALSRGGFDLDMQRAGLLHDAEEAYLPDLPRPIKVMFPEYATAGKRVMKVICARFALHEVDLDHTIKQFDHAMLATEARVLMYDHSAWYLPERPLKGIHPLGFGPPTAERMFLDEYARVKENDHG